MTTGGGEGGDSLAQKKITHRPPPTWCPFPSPLAPLLSIFDLEQHQNSARHEPVTSTGGLILTSTGSELLPPDEEAGITASHTLLVHEGHGAIFLPQPEGGHGLGSCSYDHGRLRRWRPNPSITMTRFSSPSPVPRCLFAATTSWLYAVVRVIVQAPVARGKCHLPA
nr:unnamed protein product [Digitaria exilis]